MKKNQILAFAALYASSYALIPFSFSAAHAQAVHKAAIPQQGHSHSYPVRPSIKERRIIFMELMAAGRRARKEAHAQIPDPPKGTSAEDKTTTFDDQADMTSQLNTKYRHAVAVRHRLTDEQANNILAEGLAKYGSHDY